MFLGCTVPKVESIELQNRGAFRIWFRSDDHRPPHFHLSPKSGDWEVAINILQSIRELDYRYVFQNRGEFKKGLQNEVLESISKNRAALLEEWEAKVNESDNYVEQLGEA